MIQNNLQICTKTVMDTTDPNIKFNKSGESHYYTNFIKNIIPIWKNDNSKFYQLEKIADKIKRLKKMILIASLELVVVSIVLIWYI